MATLTASGVTTSSGQLDGFYTGSTATNTSFPIGSYVYINAATSSQLGNVNTAVSVRVSNSGLQNRYQFTVYGGSVLSGTWSNRGGGWTDGSCYPIGGLVQRIA